MRHSSFLISQTDRRPDGSVLLLTLIVVALLTLGAMSFFERMFVERQAVEAHVRQTQARYLAESGVEYLRALVVQDPNTLYQSGGTWDNPTLFQGKLVTDAELAAFRGRFTVIAPQVKTDGYYGGIRYGWEDESAKLNLNTVLLADNYEQDGARNLLMALPGMNESVADAILDWIDADEEQRLLGAERDYYSSLDPPYAPRNGPLGSIEELLLVRDVTPALLFGADLNRNALVDASEEAYTVIEGVDNASGSLNRGWAAYLTIDSAERNARPDGSPKIDINAGDLQSLHDQAAEVLGEEMANFIVAYRQGGAYEGNEVGKPASGISLDFNQQGRVTLRTILDLVGVRVRVAEQGAQGTPPTVVEAAFPDDTSSMRDYLPKLFDNFAVNAAESIPGRININQAPRPLVVGIPGLELSAAEQIIYNRDPELMAERPDRAYETWLLTEGIVDLEQMKRLMPLVTAGGDVYRAQVIGYFDEEGPAYRLEVVLDATQSPPVVRRRRELVEQGPGYSLEVLGTALDDVP
jgi:DNA uptake protein ComE-like DNA-binding protein